jgi:hypothetical protein
MSRAILLCFALRSPKLTVEDNNPQSNIENFRTENVFFLTNMVYFYSSESTECLGLLDKTARGEGLSGYFRHESYLIQFYKYDLPKLRYDVRKPNMNYPVI